MRRWVKTLFCNHYWVWKRNVYGDERLHTGWTAVDECSCCGKQREGAFRR